MHSETFHTLTNKLRYPMLETAVQCLCLFSNSKFPLIWIGIVRAMTIEELATAVEMQIGVPVLCESGSTSRSSGSEVKLGDACSLRYRCRCRCTLTIDVVFARADMVQRKVYIPG